jgi:CHASE1-domain containing sensor protein
MKTQFSICQRSRQERSGSAVLVILILLCIMMVFATANSETLKALRRQVMAVDQRQTQRLAEAVTNQVHGVQSVTNAPLSK